MESSCLRSLETGHWLAGGVRTDLQCASLPQVVTRAEGKVHSLTLRNVKLAEAGEVRLAAKDFQTKANLIVKGLSLLPIKIRHSMNGAEE